MLLGHWVSVLLPAALLLSPHSRLEPHTLTVLGDVHGCMTWDQTLSYKKLRFKTLTARQGAKEGFSTHPGP